MLGGRFSNGLSADDPHEKYSHFAKFVSNGKFSSEHKKDKALTVKRRPIPRIPVWRETKTSHSQTLPHPRRSQAQPQGTAPAGVPLHGGESEGNRDSSADIAMRRDFRTAAEVVDFEEGSVIAAECSY